jgi:hypothetical protein
LPSPVRSVVICDTFQLDMELDRSKGTIGLNDPSDKECNMIVTTYKPCNGSTNLDNALYINALQIEPGLATMKLILPRFMVHPSHNQKGAFNPPVYHEALD